MSRSKVVAGVALLVLLLIGGIVVWRSGVLATNRSDENRRATASASGAGWGIARSQSDAASMRDEKLPPGFANPGASGKRVAGRVVFAGKPFAGAKVRLSAWGGQVVPSDNERTSAPDGTFDFGVRPPGTFDVAADAPDKSAAIVHVDVADPTARPTSDALELVLTACDASIVGTVRDATGGPIAGARIRREGIAGSDTDDKGEYALCVPTGETTIEVSAEGYGSISLSFTTQLRTRRDVVLVPEAVVQGIVVDELGAPVAAAFVGINAAQWGTERPAQRTGTSDADGRFRIDEVFPGRVNIWAFTGDQVSEDANEVTASVGASPDVVVKVVARVSISGKVMRDGRPVAGAKIFAVRKSPLGVSVDAFSQADGSFTLRRAPPGELTFSTPEYRVVSPSSVHVGAKSLTDVVVEVDALATIKGRVTRDEAPVVGASVCCVERVNADRQVKTDADGMYAFTGVSPGQYELSSQTAHAFAEPQKIPVVGAQDYVVNFELGHGAEIRGMLVDEQGKPVRGLWVKFQHPNTGDLCRAVSDERGRFECGAMTGGAKYVGSVFATPTMDVALPAPKGKPYPAIDLKDGRSVVENVTVTVQHHHGEIRGRVIDTKGAPVADATVRANIEERFSSWLQLASTFTDVDGNFMLDELAEGSYFVEASSTDGGTGSAKTVVGGSLLTVVVTRAGSLEGALTGFRETPHVFVTPVNASDEMRAGMVTGNRYRVGGLKPGRYIVSAETPYEGEGREVDIRSGETATLDLTSKGSGSIDIKITDYATGAGVPGIKCRVVSSVDGKQGLTLWEPGALPSSDAAGQLRVERAIAGNIVVTCLTGDGRRSRPSAELVLAQGANAKVSMQSVLREGTSWGSTGLGFDWRVVPPRVSNVVTGSGAAEAGSAPGDLITSVDDNAVGSLNGEGVEVLINNHSVGAKVPVGVTRGTQKLRLLVEVRPGN